MLYNNKKSEKITDKGKATLNEFLHTMQRMHTITKIFKLKNGLNLHDYIC